ncbi:MAG: hypothetical protein IJ640_09275 [Prevotella sp.]|nr:hypothetical protein [Prevotella sp.]
MKTDVEVRQDIYRYIINSDLKDEIGGVIGYQGRSDGAKTEDCIISVITNVNGQIQDCDVNVNIYVQNVNSGGRSVENVSRTKTLSKIAERVLRHGYGDTFRFELRTQRIVAVQGKDEFVINNKLRYKNFNNE